MVPDVETATETKDKRKPYTELGILLDSDPAAAAKRIKDRLAETRGNASEAARREGIAYATLLRYFARLRVAGHPVREEGKTGRRADEDVPRAVFRARASAVRKAARRRSGDLTHHEALILAGKYPAVGEPKSCVQLAEQLGITRQAVQQAEARALAKLGLAET